MTQHAALTRSALTGNMCIMRTMDLFDSDGMDALNAGTQPASWDTYNVGAVAWLRSKLGTRHHAVWVDIETTGLSHHTDEIVGVALSVWGDPAVFYFAVAHVVGNVNDERDVMHDIIRLLNSAESVHGHNVKFDAHFLVKHGFSRWAQLVDTLALAHLYNENMDSYALKKVCVNVFGDDANKSQTELLQYMSHHALSMSDMRSVPAWVVCKYAEDDVRLCIALERFITSAMVKRTNGLNAVSVVNEYTTCAWRMELRGVGVNVELLHKDCQRAETEENKLANTTSCNYMSVVDIKRVTGLSDVNEESLALCGTQEAAVILRCRKLLKLRTSFGDAIAKSVHLGGTNRAHPTINLHGTVTGRTSCVRPNLMALSRDDSCPSGYSVRSWIVPSHGWLLLSADYSQAELRVCASLAKEERMIDVLKAGRDLHGETAKSLGIPRDYAKRINFGIVYGLGANGLSTHLGIAHKEAEDMLAAWHALYPGVRRFSNWCTAHARSKGYIQVFTGRRRHYTDKDETHRAMSNLVQCTVSEIIKIASARVESELPHRCSAVMQVYDQLLIEVEAHDTGVYKRIKQLMTDFDFTVPLTVDIKVGESMQLMEKVT